MMLQIERQRDFDPRYRYSAEVRDFKVTLLSIFSVNTLYIQ